MAKKKAENHVNVLRLLPKASKASKRITMIAFYSLKIMTIACFIYAFFLFRDIYDL